MKLSFFPIDINVFTSQLLQYKWIIFGNVLLTYNYKKISFLKFFSQTHRHKTNHINIISVWQRTTKHFQIISKEKPTEAKPN